MNFARFHLSAVYMRFSCKKLADRLSKVLDDLISVNESSFVGNIYILDGVVVLNEAIEEAKRKK